MCTVYTLHTSSAYQQLPPVFYSTHGIFRGFLVYTVQPIEYSTREYYFVVHMHADRQTHTHVDTHTRITCWYHGNESLITHTMCTHNVHTQCAHTTHTHTHTHTGDYIFRTPLFVRTFHACCCMQQTYISYNVHV